MALSVTEREHRCREKEIAAGLSAVIKEKDRQHKQLTSSKMTTSQLNVLGLRQQVNLQRFLAQKRANPILPSPHKPSFSIKQSKVNAVNKTKSILPTGKNKKN